MKKTVVLLMMALMVFGYASCDKPDADKGDDDGTETPAPEPGPGENPGSGENPEKPDAPEVPYYEDFPLECGNLIAEGSEVGVTIEVTNVEDQNFVFELRPGAMVRSFKMDVYPVAQLYNNILNDKTFGNLEAAESWAVNERIRTYLFNESGSGEYAFSINDFDNDEDFLQIEFDWMNTSYAAASAIAIPDCGYVIAVVASTDEEISSATQEDLTLCYVHTTSQPLIGDPKCEIEVNAGYRKFSVNHIPNSDAAGVYFFGYLTEEIDAYIDAFGDTMFRDFVRTRVTNPSSSSDPEALTYAVDYGQEADASIESTTVAVAVDANLTPQEDYSRRDFSLLEMPDEEEQPEPEVSVSIDFDRVAAAYFEFDVNFSKDCQTVFYRFYSKEQKEALENGTSLDRKKEAIDMMQNGGYGWHNPNFAWDKNGGEDGKGAATGSGAVVRLDAFGGLYPGSTYYVGYTGRNGFGSLSEVAFSEAVVMDERNLISPDDCKVKDLTLTLDNPGRTSFRGTVTYDPSTVSVVYIQYMTADNNPGLDENSSWADWTRFIFTPSVSGTGSSEASNLLVNPWPTLSSGRDGLTWTGMTPDTEYTVFMCAEDFDGNISPMYFESISTKEVQVGPDPTIKMELVPADSYPYDWTVTYTIDHDVEFFLYCYADNVSDLSPFINGLTAAGFNDVKNSGIGYEAWRDGIYEWVSGGFDNTGGGMRTESDTSQDWSGDKTVIAACIAVGRDSDGKAVHKMYHLICKDGKAQTLEEIFGITE